MANAKGASHPSLGNAPGTPHPPFIKRLTHDGTRVLLAEKDHLGRFKKRIITGLETLMKFCAKDPKAKGAMDALVDVCGGVFLDLEMDKPAGIPAEKTAA